MQRLKEKKQLQKGKDNIIEHIQQKLRQIRQQRTLYEQNKMYEIEHPINQLNIDPNSKDQNKLSTHLREKLEQSKTKQKLNELQVLYNHKKQLKQIGIFQNDFQKIKKLYGDPKIQTKLKQYNPKAKQIKNQVLQQQMKNIQKLINKKKATKKQLKELQEMNFKIISELHPQKQKAASRYEQLLNKSKHQKLSIIQKQQVVQISFSFIKQGIKTAQKSKIKQFLLANQNFCNIFYVTNQQIYRDLQVYDTKDQGLLDERQFYEFLKSIQISNPMLKPSLKYNSARNTQIKPVQQLKWQKQINNKTNINNNSSSIQKKDMISYMKKLFQYFDAKKQKIIERQKFQISLKKCLLFDVKLYKALKKEHISIFLEYLIKSRQCKNRKSYYMKLQGKYIGWQQIQQIYSNFCKNIPVIDQSKFASNGEQIKNNQQNVLQEDKQKQAGYIPQKISKGSLEQYFEQYGWSKNKQVEKSNLYQSQSCQLNQLTRLDKQYKALSSKHGNQIQWQGYAKQYKQDFSKLEAYIKNCEQKMKSNKKKI